MKKLLLFALLALPGFSQIITTVPSSNSLKSSIGIINSNFSNLNSYKGNVFSGSGAPGSIPLSVLGSQYLDTLNVRVYVCFKPSGACTTVAAANWVAVSGVVNIASGVASLGTSSISSAACATVVTVSTPGVLTTDAVQATFNADPTSTVGYIPATTGLLNVFVYPTANNVNFKVCNTTANPITPGAIVLNFKVTR